MTATVPENVEGGSKQTRDVSPQKVVVVALTSPNMTSNPWKKPLPRQVTSIPPALGPSAGIILCIIGGRGGLMLMGIP